MRGLSNNLRAWLRGRIRVGLAVVVVVVDTPGLRDNTVTLAVGRRRKGSKAHLTPEMETDYPYIEVYQKRLHWMRVLQFKTQIT